MLKFTGTITPWLLGAFFILLMLTASLTLKAWREAKRSPYFFLRLQAQKRLQTYSLACVGLVLATFATAAYTREAPADAPRLAAMIRNGKPLDEAAAPATEETAATSPTVVQIGLDRPDSPVPADRVTAPTLPEEYDRFEPTAELSEDTRLAPILFSTRIDDNYQAVEPGRRFGKGFFTLYATFDYETMANGMEWAWLWRHNGAIVGGGNELWAYGDEGPGYIYYRPEEGFRVGIYTLEVWVNGRILTQGTLEISDSIEASN